MKKLIAIGAAIVALGAGVAAMPQPADASNTLSNTLRVARSNTL